MPLLVLNLASLVLPSAGATQSKASESTGKAGSQSTQQKGWEDKICAEDSLSRPQRLVLISRHLPSQSAELREIEKRLVERLLAKRSWRDSKAEVNAISPGQWQQKDGPVAKAIRKHLGDRGLPLTNVDHATLLNEGMPEQGIFAAVIYTKPAKWHNIHTFDEVVLVRLPDDDPNTIIVAGKSDNCEDMGTKWRLHSLLAPIFEDDSGIEVDVIQESPADTPPARQYVELESVVVAALQPFGIARCHLDDSNADNYVSRVRAAAARLPEIGMVGDTLPFRRLCRDLCQAADLDGHVLIMGETGTGKEACARLVHELRWPGVSLKQAPDSFKSINCATFSKGTMVSEVFGYAKGHHTGATEDREGLISTDGKGTLFLDEIHLADNDLVGALLRYMQEFSFRRLGDHQTTSQTSEQRIVAATNKEKYVDSRELLPMGFIQRFASIVKVPPLRERPEDIPRLITHFLSGCMENKRRRERENEEKNVVEIALQHAPFFHGLAQNEWRRGNVRELRNAVREWFSTCCKPFLPAGASQGKRGKRYIMKACELLSIIEALPPNPDIEKLLGKTRYKSIADLRRRLKKEMRNNSDAQKAWECLQTKVPNTSGRPRKNPSHD